MSHEKKLFSMFKSSTYVQCTLYMYTCERTKLNKNQILYKYI